MLLSSPLPAVISSQRHCGLSPRMRSGTSEYILFPNWIVQLLRRGTNSSGSRCTTLVKKQCSNTSILPAQSVPIIRKVIVSVKQLQNLLKVFFFFKVNNKKKLFKKHSHLIKKWLYIDFNVIFFNLYFNLFYWVGKSVNPNYTLIEHFMILFVYWWSHKSKEKKSKIYQHHIKHKSVSLDWVWLSVYVCERPL